VILLQERQKRGAGIVPLFYVLAGTFRLFFPGWGGRTAGGDLWVVASSHSVSYSPGLPAGTCCGTGTGSLPWVLRAARNFPDSMLYIYCLYRGGLPATLSAAWDGQLVAWLGTGGTSGSNGDFPRFYSLYCSAFDMFGLVAYGVRLPASTCWRQPKTRGRTALYSLLSLG